MACGELFPAVLEAAKWFPEVNHDVLHAPRYRVIMGDGRNYAMIASRQYDVISVDATTPKMAGDGSLYTLEFYRLIAQRLSDDGLAVQWLPFPLLSDAEVRMTARTFMAAFPPPTLWLSPLRYQGPQGGSPPPAHHDLPALRRYVDGGPLNTDNHPYLEFTPAWSYVVALRYALENLAGFQQHRQSAVPLLVQAGQTPAAAAAFADSVARRYDATQHGLKGEILYYLGRRAAAAQEWSIVRSVDSAAASIERTIWGGPALPPEE